MLKISEIVELGWKLETEFISGGAMFGMSLNGNNYLLHCDVDYKTELTVGVEHRGNKTKCYTHTILFYGPITSIKELRFLMGTQNLHKQENRKLKLLKLGCKI